MNVTELAEAAGLSARAIRFYVQQRLIPPPGGLGRGSHYDQSHLDRLRQIADLQSAGHSLDAIRRILDGEPAPQVTRRVSPQRRAMMSAELFTRVSLGEGVELQFDAGRYQPNAEGLLALRDLARQVFQQSDESKR